MGGCPGLARVNSCHGRARVKRSSCCFPQHCSKGRGENCCARRRVGRVIGCTSSHFVAIVPRVRVPKRTSTTLTSCPRLSYKLKGACIIHSCFSIFSRICYPGRRAFRFLRGILARIVRLFPDRCVRVNKSRYPGGT